MSDVELEQLIALITKRANDAARFPAEARRHLVNAGGITANGRLAPVYASKDDTLEETGA